MGETTGIEWTDSTFNAWIGCTKIANRHGSACDHCYAVSFGRRLGVSWGDSADRHRTRPENWKKVLQWNADGPRFQCEHGRRQRVFAFSLADWLDNQVDPQWRADFCRLVDETPHLDWLLLTKRLSNYHKLAPIHWRDGAPPNVWLGITVEDRERYRARYAALARIPAAVRFLSFEPGLGALGDLDIGAGNIPDWIITGGLSGVAAARSTIFPPAAVRAARDMCIASDVAFFHKQWGHYGNNPLVLEQGMTPREAAVIDMPANGKGGALLDGKLYREFPTS